MAVDLPFEAAAQGGKVTDLVGDNGLRYRSRKMRIDDSIPEAELADSPNNVRSCFQVNIDVRNRSSLEVQALQCHSMIHIERAQKSVCMLSTELTTFRFLNRSSLDRAPFTRCDPESVRKMPALQ